MKLGIELEINGVVTAVSLGFSQEKIAVLSHSCLCQASGDSIEDVLMAQVIHPSLDRVVGRLVQVNDLLAGSLEKAVLDCQAG